MQCRLSFPLKSLFQRCEKQYHIFHTKLILQAACNWSCYNLLSPDLRNMRDMSWMHSIYVWLLVVLSAIRTCHNKLNCTFYLVDKASKHITSKLGIVSRVDVLDNQCGSSFNFNSSFVRKWNIRMFLDTTSVINHHFDKCTIYQNTIESALNVIMWISVVPHQVGITTIIEVAWTRRFLGEMHIHTS